MMPISLAEVALQDRIAAELGSAMVITDIFPVCLVSLEDLSEKRDKHLLDISLTFAERTALWCQVTPARQRHKCPLSQQGANPLMGCSSSRLWGCLWCVLRPHRSLMTSFIAQCSHISVSYLCIAQHRFSSGHPRPGHRDLMHLNPSFWESWAPHVRRCCGEGDGAARSTCIPALFSGQGKSARRHPGQGQQVLTKMVPVIRPFLQCM